jgi:hypothetical protein
MFRPGLTHDNPKLVGVAFIAIVAILVGSGIVLAGEPGIYVAIGLIVLGVALLLFGPLIRRLVETLGLMTLALASSLLWFSLVELFIGAKTEWGRFNQGILVRVQGVGVGMFILPFAAWFLFRLIVRQKTSRLNGLTVILGATVVLGGVTMLVGIARGNSIGYVLGDTYKFALIPITYWVCVEVVSQPHQRQFLWKFLMISGLVVSIVGMLIQFYKFAIGWRYRLGKDVDLFALAAFVLLYLSSARKMTKRLSLLAIALLVIGAVVSLQRRDWLFVILVWGFAALIKKGWSRARLIWLTLISCVLLLLGFLFLRLALPGVLEGATMHLERRLAFTFEGDEPDSSVGRRLDEIEYVVQEFQDASPIYLLIGLGQGAEFYDPVSGKAGSQAELVHNIHNTYVSVIFRTGIIGLLLTAGFVFLSLKLAYDCARHARRDQSVSGKVFLQAALIYLLVSFIVSWNVAPSIGEVHIAVIIGLVASTRRWQLKQLRSASTVV